MKFKEIIGIDVGKLTNDAVIHTSQTRFKFSNDSKGFKNLINTINKKVTCKKSEILIAFEHTGIYSFPLSVFLTDENINFAIFPGLEIKRSLGIQRGKDDAIDAQRIALYTYRRKDEITPYKLPSKEFIRIKRLLTLRDKLVRQQAGYKGTIKENKKFLVRKDNLSIFSIQEKMVKELNKGIEKLDKELMDIVNEDDDMKKTYNLVTSVMGVGMQTALYMIAITNGFTTFKNHRQFASYSGTAPFPYLSGTSIKGRTKVSHLANKKMKSLLSSCANSAIVHDPEIRAFYKRRIEEGKHKMSTINVVRNKILARIFAVVNRGTPFVNTYGYAS